MNPRNTQIITANNLLSGEVVYLTSSETWSTKHSDASVFGSDKEANHRLASVLQTDTSVVGPYLAFAKTNTGKSPEPVHFREVFRTIGPSNRFIGKQAAAT